MIIQEVKATKIKDSRGAETIEVSVNGCCASSPSGKSTGEHETPSYRKDINWNVEAINNFKEIIDVRIDEFGDLKKVEDLIVRKFKLKNVKQFGANALFALESAILKAVAESTYSDLWKIINPKAKKMPIPVGNAVGGGMHSYDKNKPVFQEFLLIPNERTFKDNVSAMRGTYELIGKIIMSQKKNDEGAWETSLNNEDVLTLVMQHRGQLRIGLDIAASSLFTRNHYKYYHLKLSRKQQIEYIKSLIERFELFYVEDPLDEEDFEGFAELPETGLIVGDDLTATHIERLKKAVKMKSINAIIVKPNQNGSLLEVKEIVDFCKKNSIKIVFSHRSGETMDDALADYAFGFQAEYIKCGISTKWREVKLKRLIEIEKSLK